MTHTELETLPATWSDERDGAFFAIVRNLFRPAFTSGATSLLMSYDEDTGTGSTPVVRPVAPRRVLLPVTQTPRS